MKNNFYNNLKKIIKNRPFFIAEAGVNHNGKLSEALRLVSVAKKLKCDAIKFQTWKTEHVYNDKSLLPDYQEKNLGKKIQEFKLIKSLELKKKDFKKIKNFCKKKKIIFFSTPDEIESANFLNKLKVKLFKVSSQDLTNLPFIKFLTKFKLPIIISTGASTVKEIKSAIKILQDKKNKFIIFHCISAYPAPHSQLNLNFIKYLKKKYKNIIGFSDHTLGSESACAAVALGAKVFEKHLTLNKKMKGPDHAASLNPEEMKDYIAKVTNAFKSLGKVQKKIMPCEINTRKAFKRFLVASKDLKKGSILHQKHFFFKKTVHGINVNLIDKFIGKKMKKKIRVNENFKWSHIK